MKTKNEEEKMFKWENILNAKLKMLEAKRKRDINSKEHNAKK